MPNMPNELAMFVNEDGLLVPISQRPAVQAEVIEQVMDDPTGFASFITITATAEVMHHAPCVPECPVCYPEGE